MNVAELMIALNEAKPLAKVSITAADSEKNYEIENVSVCDDGLVQVFIADGSFREED